MIVKNLHAFSHKPLKLDDLARALRRLGLSPVFATARKMVSEELAPFGINVPFTFGRLTEVFGSVEQEQAVLARTSQVTVNNSEVTLFDLVCLSQMRPVENLLQAVSETLEVELLDNSYNEEQLTERIRGWITGTSPNGKLLEIPTVKVAAMKLEDDRIRGQLKELFATLGGISVSRSALEGLPSLRAIGAIEGLIAMGALTPNFQIRCKSCDTPHLVFTERLEAEKNLGGSVKCPCGNSRLQVAETYAIDESYQRALQQGVWLEALVGDVADSRACRQWNGSVLGTDEIDVLCVIANRIVMFECKDRNLGQNDLYVAAVKSRAKADMVVFVSTQPLHSNVQQGISALNRAGSGGRDGDRYVAITSDSAAKLRYEITKFLNTLRTVSYTHLTLPTICSV